LIAWVVLVGLGVAVHWALWIAPRLDPPIETFRSWPGLTRLSNITTTFATPGMILTTRVVGRLFPLDLPVTFLSYGVSWAIWLGLLWGLARIRAGLVAGQGPGAGGEAGLSNPGRRALLVNGTFAGGGLAAAGTLGYATLVEPFDLRLTRRTVTIKGWPAALEGYRAVLIADTHLGPRVPEEHIRRAYAMAAAAKPDLLLLGGDYVHNGAKYFEGAAALMRELLVPIGVPIVGVLGNHDWYAGGPEARRALQGAGVELIDNDRVFLDASTRRISRTAGEGPGVCIAGVGDLWEDRVDFVSALDGVPGDMPRIVLSHQPDTAQHEQLYTRMLRVDLIMSGHTHGGQVRLPILGSLIVPSQFGQRYAYGLNAGPHCPVLTTSGVGMSIVPLRINMPPEIVEITFRAG
jgi:uncharacterized protein